MAKNNYRAQVNQYANREEAVRKARGNPNKNVHTKKKNSNYGGYTAGNYVVDKIGEKVKKQEHVQLPAWMRIALAVDFVVLIVLLVLRLTVLKDNEIMAQVTTLMLGVTCAALFYIRRFKHQQKSAGYTVIQVLLCIVAVLYIGMSVIGLLTYAGLI